MPAIVPGSVSETKLHCHPSLSTRCAAMWPNWAGKFLWTKTTCNYELTPRSRPAPRDGDEGWIRDVAKPQPAQDLGHEQAQAGRRERGGRRQLPAQRGVGAG